MGKALQLPAYFDIYWEKVKYFRKWAKRSVTFFTLHLSYIIAVGMVGALAIWGGPQGTDKRISFADALFNSFSAVCCCGISTVYMATFSTFGVVVLMLEIIMGSNVATSVWPVLIRIHYFRKYSLERYKIDPLQVDVDNHPVNDLTVLPGMRPESLPRDPTSAHEDPENGEVHSVPASSERHSQGLSLSGFDNLPYVTKVSDHNGLEQWTQRSTLGVETMRRRLSSLGLPDKEHPNVGTALKYILSQTNPDPNRPEHLLSMRSEAMDVEIGHYLDIIELRALLHLRWLVPTYFVVLQVLGFALTCLVFQVTPRERRLLQDKNGVNPWWFAGFQTVSAFNQGGFALLEDSYIQLQRALAFLLIQTVLVLLGNTMFPVALYAIIWTIQRFSEEGDTKDAFNYLLQHPRHCFTHLFPWEETKWLLWTIIVFNLVELAFFLGLDWDTRAIAGLSPFHKVAVGLGQSVNTRSVGLSYINIAEASPAMWMIYLGFMYVAVYPVHFARVNSRISQPSNEEWGIGVDSNVIKYLSHSSTLVQGWMLVARDSVLVFVAILAVCVFERDNLIEHPENFHVFKIMFEIISLYGNVGLSLGISCGTPGCVSPPYGFTGSWGVPSKLVAIVVLLAGRHRTLPNNIDYSVNIPKRVRERKKRLKASKRHGSSARFAQDTVRGDVGQSTWTSLPLQRRPTWTDLLQMFRENERRESGDRPQAKEESPRPSRERARPSTEQERPESVVLPEDGQHDASPGLSVQVDAN